MKTGRVYFKQLNKILSFSKKGKLFLVIIGIGISSLLELLGVSIIYPFIDIIMGSGLGNTTKWLYAFCEQYGLEPLGLLALLMILLYLFKNVFLLLYYRFEIRTFYELQSNLAVKLMDAYMRQPYTFFVQENSSLLLSVVQWDVPQFCQALRSMMVICSHSLLTVLLVGLLLVVNARLTIIMILVLALCMLLFRFTFQRKAKFYGQKAQKGYGEIYQWSEETIGGIKEIRVMRREDFFLKGFRSIYENFRDANSRFSFLNLLPRLILEVACVATIVLFIVYEMKRGQSPNAYIPALSVFAMAFFRMFPRIGEISTSYNNVLYSKASVESVYHILNRMDCEETINPVPERKEAVRFESILEGKQLSYHYPGTEKNILENADFTIEKGSAVAFVGSSGVGKTTLIHLLLGLLVPDEGTVTCDGHSANVADSDFYRQFGYVPQMIFIADDTIRNNVVFGAHALDKSRDELVFEALEEANIADLVRSLPKGLDTTIGENGIRLSGGERQRLGIARAIYHKPEILIMDEATSSLDFDTEKAVIETIIGLKGKKTLIIIAHRLSTIKDCDVIYKMENGKINKVSYQEL